ncbi:hypothetical protein [uncultured Paraglaciecola sp.]|uniref:hypothetical protein n=1 Tax=uncultured Paraglaciecola sp. TaxID=1765024 RepID=UPI0026286219|nr:hypothetical protein [uncultured Paraglaciecola sp.]
MMIFRLLLVILLFVSYSSFGQVATTVLDMQLQGKNQQDYSLFLSQNHVANINKQQQLQELYDRSSKTLYILDHKQQQYRSFSTAKAKRYADGIQAMFADFEKKIGQLPKDQRAKQIARLNKLFNGGKNTPPVKSQYSATKQQQELAGVGCELYEIYEQEALKGQTCVAEPNAIINGTGLLEMLQTMDSIYTLIVDSVQGKLHLNLPNNPMAPLAKLGKIPLSIERHSSGLSMQLVSVTQSTVDEDFFSLPSGFTEVKDDMNKQPASR